MNSLIVEFPRPACKPHSVSGRQSSARRSSLWARRCRLALAAYPEPGRLQQAPAPVYSARRRAASTRSAGRLLLGLAPGGGCLAAAVTRRAGELLPRLFTLAPASRRRPAHCVSVARSGSLANAVKRLLILPGDYPAPCSMECGLSSTRLQRAAIARPTWD